MTNGSLFKGTHSAYAEKINNFVHTTKCLHFSTWILFKHLHEHSTKYFYIVDFEKCLYSYVRATTMIHFVFYIGDRISHVKMKCYTSLLITSIQKSHSIDKSWSMTERRTFRIFPFSKHYIHLINESVTDWHFSEAALRLNYTFL